VNAAPAPSALHVRVTGRVQGVGFREACVVEAQAIGVAGWVRDHRDGTVEAWLQGPPVAVQRLLDWMREGPPLARVEGVDAVPCDVQALSGFERRQTV
jgi:acylphosphatase